MAEKHAHQRLAIDLFTVEKNVRRIVDAAQVKPEMCSWSEWWSGEGGVEPVGVKGGADAARADVGDRSVILSEVGIENAVGLGVAEYAVLEQGCEHRSGDDRLQGVCALVLGNRDLCSILAQIAGFLREPAAI